MSVPRMVRSACLPLLFISAAPAAAQPTQPDMSGLSDAQLEDELARRRVCRTLQAEGRARLFAECAQVAAPARRQLAQNRTPQSLAAPPPAPEPEPEPEGGEEPVPAPGAAPAQAQQPAAAAGQTDQTPPRNLQRELADDADNRQKFGGLEFGIGLAFSLDLGERMRVREARLVNGIVRVTRSGDVNAGLILETHYLFTPPGRGLEFLGIRNPTRDEMNREKDPLPARWGFGPFIAVRPGTDNIIDAIGGGLMLGLRRPLPGTDSFNIGVGILYDIDVQTLGDGIFENQPLPAGETEIRFQRRAQSGLMVMSSFTF